MPASSLKISHRPWRRKLALIPAAVWLMAQAVMAGWLPVVAPAIAGQATAAGEDAAALRALGLEQIVICTPTGLRVVAFDPAAPVPPEDADTTPCQWCKAFGAAAPPKPVQDFSAVVFSPERLTYRLAATGAALQEPDPSPFASRAPPRLI